MTLTNKPTAKTTANKTTNAKKTAAATLTAPHPGTEIAVTTTLRPRVSAHRPRFTVENGRSVALAACNNKRAKAYSYGYAKTHGVTLCRKCFGGQP